MSSYSPTRGVARVAAICLVLALTLAACGRASTSMPSPSERASASASSAPQPVAGFPVTLASGKRRVVIPAEPTRIVSLSPTATETLFAIGAGDAVVAVDDQSDYPRSAPTTSLSGHEPNVEAVLELRPDLVVASGDTNRLVAGLTKAEVPILLQGAPGDLTGAYRQILQLGRATGHVDDARSVVATMKADIEEAVERASESASSTTYYHELDPTFYSVTSATFIGQLYGLLGLSNIADAATEAGAYPQLSPELIIEADPDLIFLADSECCGVTARSVARRPGWQSISAVRQRAIIELDEDISSRWGPRVPLHLKTVVEALERLAEAGQA